jgi:hypothetical protein
VILPDSKVLVLSADTDDLGFRTMACWPVAAPRERIQVYFFPLLFNFNLKPLRCLVALFQCRQAAPLSRLALKAGLGAASAFVLRCQGGAA